MNAELAADLAILLQDLDGAGAPRGFLLYGKVGAYYRDSDGAWTKLGDLKLDADGAHLLSMVGTPSR